MNLCIRESLGEYVMILSDDDILSRDYVLSMLNIFRKYDGITVAVGRQIKLSELDDSIPICANENILGDELIDGFGFLKDQLSGSTSYPIYTFFSLFAKKSEILELGGFSLYPDGSHADNFLFYSLALRGCVGFSNSVMGYRVYLKSSGLSTPFFKLYAATTQYDRDLSDLLFSTRKYKFYEKIYMRLLVKRSLVRMMSYRLLNIYSRSLRPIMYYFYVVKVRCFFALRCLF
jgi:hypothetical protein